MNPHTITPKCRLFTFPALLSITLAGTTIAQAAASSETRAEPLIWGQPIDGLRIGLVPEVLNPQLHYGDTLAFSLRVRNEGVQPVDYQIHSAETPFLTLGPGNRLRIQTGMGDVVPLHLGPGASGDVPGGTYKVQ